MAFGSLSLLTDQMQENKTFEVLNLFKKIHLKNILSKIYQDEQIWMKIRESQLRSLALKEGCPRRGLHRCPNTVVELTRGPVHVYFSERNRNELHFAQNYLE